MDIGITFETGVIVLILNILGGVFALMRGFMHYSRGASLTVYGTIFAMDVYVFCVTGLLDSGLVIMYLMAIYFVAIVVNLRRPQ